tara:strand:+ start:129 stop:500 length:372 start_codon:yes stop_codon:yes gene_type:complete
MRFIRFTVYLFFSIIFTSCDNEENISVQGALKLLDQEGVLFLDVRTFQEFNYEGSIKNALLIPINDLEKKISMLEYYKNKRIIVYCRSGRRSKMATEILKKKNFKALNLEGGFIAWENYSHSK